MNIWSECRSLHRYWQLCLMDYDTLETVKLGDLCPNWWTDSHINQA